MKDKERIKKNIEMKKEKKRKDSRMLIKFISIGSNMAYTLISPIILTFGLYLLIRKNFLKKEEPILLIVLLILGAFSGYWSLAKQLLNIKK